MPYIEKIKRPNFQTYLKVENMDEGKLNYTITNLLHQWLLKKGRNYKNINSAIGILECAKLELYRMVAAKYEDTKRLQNGAISELDAVQPNEVM